MMTIGSLFSGVGGLELGLEWAGLGETIWQVELVPFRRAVLARHFPKAALNDDVRTITGSTQRPVDLVCGGFPCQDVSRIGSGRGLAGKRSGLWVEFLRIVCELREAWGPDCARWLVVENIATAAERWIGSVARDLEERGFQILPIPLGCGDLGGAHGRPRVFLVAYADPERSGMQRQAHHYHGRHAPRDDAHGCGPSMGDRERILERFRSPEAAHQPAIRRGADGVPDRLDLGMQWHDRIGALGDSVSPVAAEVVGHIVRQLDARIAGAMNLSDLGYSLHCLRILAGPICTRCFDEGEIVPATERDLCDPCYDDASEGAYERSCSDFYGGSGPSDQDRFEAARNSGRRP